MDFKFRFEDGNGAQTLSLIAIIVLIGLVVAFPPLIFPILFIYCCCFSLISEFYSRCCCCFDGCNDECCSDGCVGCCSQKNEGPSEITASFKPDSNFGRGILKTLSEFFYLDTHYLKVPLKVSSVGATQGFVFIRESGTDLIYSLRPSLKLPMTLSKFTQYKRDGIYIDYVHENNYLNYDKLLSLNTQNKVINIQQPISLEKNYFLFGKNLYKKDIQVEIFSSFQQDVFPDQVLLTCFDKPFIYSMTKDKLIKSNIYGGKIVIVSNIKPLCQGACKSFLVYYKYLLVVYEDGLDVYDKNTLEKLDLKSDFEGIKEEVQDYDYAFVFIDNLCIRNTQKTIEIYDSNLKRVKNISIGNLNILYINKQELYTMLEGKIYHSFSKIEPKLDEIPIVKETPIQTLSFENFGFLQRNKIFKNVSNTFNVDLYKFNLPFQYEKVLTFCNY